jgi:hypothetical protein
LKGSNTGDFEDANGCIGENPVSGISSSSYCTSAASVLDLSASSRVVAVDAGRNREVLLDVLINPEDVVSFGF